MASQKKSSKVLRYKDFPSLCKNGKISFNLIIYKKGNEISHIQISTKDNFPEWPYMVALVRLVNRLIALGEIQGVIKSLLLHYESEDRSFPELLAEVLNEEFNTSKK